MGGVVSRYNAEPAPEFCGLLLTRRMSSATVGSRLTGQAGQACTRSINSTNRRSSRRSCRDGERHIERQGVPLQSIEMLSLPAVLKD